jgi:hypothetical protein
MVWKAPVRRLTLLLYLILVIGMMALLSGCLPRTAYSGRQYVLAQRDGNVYRVLSEEDPLYAQFDELMLSDNHIQRLLAAYEHTTLSYVAASLPAPRPQMVANHLVILVDSQELGVLSDVALQTPNRRVPMERALGIGRQGAVDLAWARPHMPRLLALMLLELVGVDTSLAEPLPSGWECQGTKPHTAFVVGFQMAIEAWSGAPPAPALRVASAPAEDQAGEKPAIAAAVLHRLLREDAGFYPQRYLLWFTSYEPQELALGKLLLVIQQLPGRNLSLRQFVSVYAETFPADSLRLEELLSEAAKLCAE